MHFSYRKISRPVPHNSASVEEQEAFMAEAGARIAELRGNGYAVFAGDEWSAQLWTGNGYAWRPAGGRDTVMTRFSNGSAKAFCALGEGAVRTMPADRTDSKGFLRFLEALRRSCGKFVMVLDNASYHDSGPVREGVEKMEGVELIFLPPYTTQLNPAEGQVAAFKRRLAGRYFASKDALKRAIWELADSGEVRPVKLMDYMLPGRHAGVFLDCVSERPDGRLRLNRPVRETFSECNVAGVCRLLRAETDRIFSAYRAGCPFCINPALTSGLEKL